MDTNFIIECGMFARFSFWCNILSNKHIILITLYIIYMYICISKLSQQLCLLTTMLKFNNLRRKI